MKASRTFLHSCLRHLPLILGLLLAIAFFLTMTKTFHTRTMHHDEANQALRFKDLMEGPGYKYDPKAHHGPTLYYFTLPHVWLSGKTTFAECTEATMRSVPLLASALTIVVILLHGKLIGHWTALIAAAFFACSPTFTFYSTYYIQEPIFVLALTSAILAGAYWVKNRHPASLGIAAAAIAIAIATKETWVISATAAAMAGAAICLIHKTNPKTLIPNRREWIVAAMAFFIPLVLLFTSFFTNPIGLWHVITGLYHGASQSTSLHRAPWYEYIRRFTWFKNAPGPTWTNLPIVILAIVGTVRAFVKPRQKGREFLQFIAIYAFANLAIYSVIPYKTPWCMLCFCLPTIILAAAGATWWPAHSNKIFPKIVSAIIVAITIAQQIDQALLTNGRYNTDWRNPYVYGHTVKDYLGLIKRIEEITEFLPDEAKNVFVITNVSDAWPTPWYLRKRKDVRFGDVGLRHWPPEQNPAFIIVTPETEDYLKVKDDYAWNTHALRPNTFLFLGVKKDIWERWLDHKINSQGNNATTKP